MLNSSVLEALSIISIIHFIDDRGKETRLSSKSNFLHTSYAQKEVNLNNLFQQLTMLTHWLTPSQGSTMFGKHNQGPSDGQKQKAIAAASKRTKDPLQSWTAPHRDDCPMCMLTLPISANGTTYWGCCGTTMCDGCVLDILVKSSAKSLTTCPFCNAHPSESNVKSELALAKKGRHESIRRIGNWHFWGEEGFKRDMAEGLKWYHRAVEKGSSMASGKLGQCYWWGQGVEQNYDKALEYYKKASEMGDVMSFHMIGQILLEMGEIEEAMLHLRKAVHCGIQDDELSRTLREGWREEGYITKAEYMYTLRMHQESVNAMKSQSREKAKIIFA